MANNSLKGAAALASRKQVIHTSLEATSNAHDRVMASNAKNTVESNAGKVRGCTHNGIHIFRAVPYGAATTGKNRFMPQKAASWSGVRSVFYCEEVSPFSPRTAWREDENAFGFQWYDGHPGEDCLRINVWTPAIHDNGKRPAMQSNG